METNTYFSMDPETRHRLEHQLHWVSDRVVSADNALPATDKALPTTEQAKPVNTAAL